MIFRTSQVFLPLLLLTAPQAWAVMHITPGAYPHAHQDQVHRVSAARAHAAGSVSAATISSASGTKNIAVIIVQFPAGQASLISGGHTVTGGSLTTIKGYFDAMNAYYLENSHNALILNFSYFNSNNSNASGDATPSAPYTLSLPEESYGCGDEGGTCSGVTFPSGASLNANGNYLIRDALAAARTTGGASHANLDSSHFDAIIVVHAGNGNETTQGKNGDIWSIFYADDPGTPVIASGGGGFTEGDVVPETELAQGGCAVLSPFGVMCHEFGHSLGLPDLYNTSAIGGSSVLGKWEIMDAGPYDGCGANPAHHGAWSKMVLGWVTPTVASSSRLNTSLSHAETAASLLKIPVLNGLAEEYFLVEYRSTTASGAQYDHSIPGTGLLIWHVDNAIATNRGINPTGSNISNSVNTGIPHYGVSIVSADGSNIGQTGGAATNVFSNQSVFTTPQSDNFNAQPSGVSVVNIAGVGSGSVSVSLQVANLQVTAGQNISKIINYPNPAGKGYAHPSGEGHTTIQMQFTRPASDYQINIYTLSGELVRKVGKDDITLNVDRSADDKWVYEFIWDLKNADGRMVAPGVYLYLGRADGKSKSGKAVIIR